MDKKQFLKILQQKVQDGEISRGEIENALNTISPLKKGGNFSVTRMFYVIGAAIVVIGIIMFVSLIWEDIGSIGRITVTLGLGMLFALFGSVLIKQKPSEHIGDIFHVIGGVLIPSGALVTLSELSNGSESIWPVTITIGSIFLFYILLAQIHKRPVLTFFAIINGSAFLFLMIESLVQTTTFRYDNLYAYVTMVTGVSYLLLAQGFKNTWNQNLCGLLHFFGITFVLGAGYTQVFDSMTWLIIYFFLVGTGLFLSVYMKSRVILIISTLFLVAHIAYITGKYFADSIGWPITLVLLGFIFIALGYSSFRISKKYIQ